MTPYSKIFEDSRQTPDFKKILDSELRKSPNICALKLGVLKMWILKTIQADNLFWNLYWKFSKCGWKYINSNQIIERCSNRIVIAFAQRLKDSRWFQLELFENDSCKNQRGRVEINCRKLGRKKLTTNVKFHLNWKHVERDEPLERRGTWID